MAKHLKKRPVSEAEEGLHWFEKLGADKRAFSNTFLANVVIEALILRIKRQRPKEARFLRRLIYHLRAGDECFVISSENLEEFKRTGSLPMKPTHQKLTELLLDRLRTMVHGKVPRDDHDRYTIHDQRNRINKYFEDHPVAPSLSAREYKTWLMKHGEKLREILGEYPCLCEYRSSFEGINEVSLLACRGPGELTGIILAELHESTPEAMRKALKPIRK